MGASAFLVALTFATSGLGQSFTSQDYATQNKMYKSWWGENLEIKFANLPTEGGVPEDREPYCGYIYPDKQGGTIGAMRKYDRAFNRGNYLATRYEQYDTTAYKKREERRGLFGRMRLSTPRTPDWHGHCNGWAAAAIRHAEPQRDVVRNGVRFDTADIKALLAEIYIYRYPEMLAGEEEYVVDAPTLHVIMTNWLGRNKYPVAMEGTPGEEKWNYPIYKFETSTNRINSRRVQVEMTITYATDLDQEFYYEAPNYWKTRWFNYYLDLNSAGEIIGGRYYNNSGRVDMLWVPKAPIAGGQKDNERGNPHVNVNEVLAIWRDSVPQEVRENWHNHGPRPVASAQPVETAADDAVAAPAPVVVEPDPAPVTVETDPAPVVVELEPAPVTVETDPAPSISDSIEVDSQPLEIRIRTGDFE